MFKVNIGLENHVRLNVDEKLFCGCKDELETCCVCLGHPGTMPNINLEALEKIKTLALALNFYVFEEQYFDRKHYIYHDLPKMYQITQFKQPFGINGYIHIGNKFISINRICLEEDAAKTIHKNTNKLSVDFTRSGSPLAEITTDVCFETAGEVCDYLTQIRYICECLNIISDKPNSLRCDVNISITENDINYNRSEIKNLSSLSEIKTAIEQEIQRQYEVIQKGVFLEQTTRGFNGKEVYFMRYKTDYIFIPEYDLGCVKLTLPRFKPKLPLIMLENKNFKQEEMNKLIRIFSKGKIGMFQDLVNQNLEFNIILNLLDNDMDLTYKEVMKLYNCLQNKTISFKELPEIVTDMSIYHEKYENKLLKREFIKNIEIEDTIKELDNKNLNINTLVKELKQKFPERILNFDTIKLILKKINDLEK